MRLLNRIFGRSHRPGRSRLLDRGAAPAHTAHHARFEQMEPRQLLNADPLLFGAVYVEQDLGTDLQGDTFEITFVGGAAATELTSLSIDGDQGEPGFSVGDVLLDTEESVAASPGLGADHAFPVTIVSADGIDRVTWDVRDGTSLMQFQFQGFQAGEKLVLTVDVDEAEDFDPAVDDIEQINEGIDPITSGVEFQGSRLTAHFSAPHYQEVDGATEFRNRYDSLLDGTGLPLPPDDAGGKRDRTAGAVGRLQQPPKPIAISGTVYEEVDLDLVQDPGENGIAGVTVSLWTKRGDHYVDTNLTATTDAQGRYEFGRQLQLLPGVYQIRETQPDDYFSVGARAGSVDGDRVGQTLADDPDVLTEIAIPLGDLDAVDYDFAEARPAAIAGYVYEDANDNGVREAAEVGIPRVAIRVTPVDTVAPQVERTAITDASGHYQVDGLAPGTYRVVQPVQPAGYFDGKDRAGNVAGKRSGRAVNPGDEIRDVRLGGGQAGTEYNFGELRPAAVAGAVYHDRNLDGVRSDNEAAIAGVALRLIDSDGRVVATQRTDETGGYEFTNLPEGDYTVAETQPDGWLDGTDAAGTIGGTVVGTPVNPGDRITDVRLRWGERGEQYNFGEFKPVAIHGQVEQTAGEHACFDSSAKPEPLGGVTVTLWDDAGQMVRRTTTGPDGNYHFEGLHPGVYTVVEETPSDLFDGGERVGTIDGVPTGRIVADDTIAAIALDSAQVGVGYDFCEHPPATLSGAVYHDRDNDGRKGADEEPIGQVRVVLLDAGTGQVVARGVTDAQGRYTLSGLAAGNYVVRQLQPDGWLDGLDRAGTINGKTVGQAVNPGDEIRQIELAWGDQAVDYDFGEQRHGTVAGMVHTDILRDCIYEPSDGERGIPRVQIQLLDAQGRLVQTTQTDQQGRYRFDDVVPGQYSLRELQPPDLFQGGQRAGSHGGDDSVDDWIAGFPVGSGQHLVHYDFCEEPPATISGFVFQDGPAIRLVPGDELPDNLQPLRDGRLTPDDIRLPGVELHLSDGFTGHQIETSTALPGRYTGQFVTTRTDANGFYQFTGIPHGNYSVYQVHPQGYVDGIDTVGTRSGVAFNAGQPVSPLIRDSLEVDPQNDAIVRIAMPPGSVSSDNNFSEIRVDRVVFLPPNIPVPPPPLPPRPPTLAPAVPPPVLLPPLVVRQPTFESYGSAGTAYTWHLSVVDAGYPRGTGVALAATGTIWLSSATSYPVDTARMAEGGWTLQPEAGRGPQAARRSYEFGLRDAVPVAGDFDGDGKSEIGVFYRGQWYIDLNGNGVWDQDDLWAKLGTENDLPVTGDWDGDGKDDIGIFGPIWPGDRRAIEREPGLPDNQNEPTGQPKNLPPKPEDATSGRRLLRLTAAKQTRADLIDHVFHYGVMADIPVVGDWNGDGIKSIGVFRHGRWHLDVDGDGQWSPSDRMADFGRRGDVPVTGDFNGDGVDEIGFYRDGIFYLDTNGNGKLDESDKHLDMRDQPGRPVVGDWDGDGTDEVAVYHDRPAVRQARAASAGDNTAGSSTGEAR